MATNKKLEVTDLDFDDIKTNLKKFFDNKRSIWRLRL